MKRFVSLLVVLMLCLQCLPAMATSAQYNNTRRVLQILDSEGIIYTVNGILSNNYEKVSINSRDSDINKSYTITLFFSSDNEEFGIRVWNLIDFNASKLQQAYKLCNTANSSYKLVTFEVDESDNSITVACDMIVRDTDETGSIVLEAICRVADIIGAAYPTLSPLE